MSLNYEVLHEGGIHGRLSPIGVVLYVYFKLLELWPPVKGKEGHHRLTEEAYTRMAHQRPLFCLIALDPRYVHQNSKISTQIFLA